ncbi:MAG: MBOAT family O-acyltransferase [Coriobacteriales bacterium]|nr:MBOAT family O-acyltransferase [Coriobacteriales bacterium]
MVFSSFVFLFVFLALHLLAYALTPERHKNKVLLASSLIFYAWGGPRYLFLLMGETAICWFAALTIERRSKRRQKRTALILACVALLGLLAYFKYTNFLLGITQSLFGFPHDLPNIVLPIGISFYTFQLISYVADVYRGQVTAQPTYWKLLLYSSLFHQCIAGPIVRYETVSGEIDRRKVTRSDINYGVRRFCVGLAKKTLLANACAAAADTLVPIGGEALQAQAVSGYWLGMLFYMLQIYLDFSAYSDMAIGLGRMIGFHYLENFNHPYLASSAQDFWRRWHISLSSFFRDYVYIPLGGSRCSTLCYIRNLSVVWFLTGLWHGASWNYILWGLYYLALLLLERFVIRNRLPKALGHILALLAVFFGWVLFRFEDFSELGIVLAGMFGGSGGGLTSLAVHTVFMQNIFLLAISIVACTNLGSLLRKRLFSMGRTNGALSTFFNITEALTPPVLLILSTIALAGASYNPFIYFQF